jgi:lipopolysaccharide exporter
MDEPDADQQVSGQDLRDAAVDGIRWIAIGRIASDVVQFFAAVALARLISPAEFGHAAVALILVPLSAILTFEGFGSALVQRDDVRHEHLEAAALASVVAGIGMCLLAVALAPVIGAPVFGNRTARLMQLASPLFAIAGLSAVARSVLWRELRFRTASVIEITSLLFTAAVSVTLAATGMGAEAIVFGALAGATVATILFLVVVPPVRPAYHRLELREILSFGGPASGAGLLHVAITNVDYTIIAARLGATQTGFYWRAFQLGVVYQDKLSGVFMRVAFPVYSRTKDLNELIRLHERAARVHAAIVVPLLGVLLVVAPVLVPWLFGPQWRAAIVPAQILAVAGMAAAILTGFAQVLLAAGRPKALFRFNVGVLIVYGSAVWFTAPHGIRAVAVAVTLSHLLMLAVVYGILFGRVLDVPVRRMVADLAPAGVGCSALLLACLPLVSALRGAGAPAPVTIFCAGVTGLAVHALVVRALFPACWADVASLVRRLLPARVVQPRWAGRPLARPEA